VVVPLGLTAAVAVAAGLRAAADVVAPAMLTLTLTIAVLPADAWARRRDRPGWLATLFVLVVAYAIMAVLVLGTVLCLVKLVELPPAVHGLGARPR
jgi:hypothetical protein